MRRTDHPLKHQRLGRQTSVTSLYFGPSGANRKAYIYPYLAHAVHDKVKGRLGADADNNVALVRAAVLQFVQDWKPANAARGMSCPTTIWPTSPAVCHFAPAICWAPDGKARHRPWPRNEHHE